MSRAPAALLLTLVLACRGSPDRAPISLETEPAGADTRLTLFVAPGLRLNARLEPALELAGGPVIRFHASRVTPDSAYFAEPPVALLPGRHPQVHGRLRASVCDSGASVCRTVEADL